MDDPVLRKLQSFSEYDLTHRVLVPLFKALGYDRVHYTGGPGEEGKDLVCWRKNEIGEEELTVAQVKKYKASARAADKNSFSEIVTQLSQAIEKKVPHVDGSLVFPEIVYLITPFPIDTAALKSRFEGYRALLPNRVRVMDGPRLVHVIKDRLPEFFRDLLGAEEQIRSLTFSQLTNEVLLGALELEGGRDVWTFYTDVDFSLANPIIRRLFTSRFEPSVHEFEVNLEEWEILCEIEERTQSTLGCGIIDDSMERIRLAFRDLQNLHRKWEVGHAKILEEYNLARNMLEDKKKDAYLLESDPGARASHWLMMEERERAEKDLEHAESLYRASVSNEPQMSVSVRLNGTDLIDAIHKGRVAIESTIKRLNAEQPSPGVLAIFLEDCATFYSVGKAVLEDARVAKAIGAGGASARRDAPETRLSIPVQNVLETGRHLLILGEPGVGKTTALQMYAHNLLRNPANERLVIFSPLVRLVRRWHDAAPSDFVQRETPRFERGLCLYLRSFGITVAEERFMEELERRRAILLLDGVDEVFDLAPWIGRSIDMIASRLVGSQIVVSSRVSGRYLDQLPFFGVFILPFTDGQLIEFIEKWFEVAQIREARKVIAHLDRMDIRNVVRTPLLATILCTLAERGIPLPDTEARLYDERLRLMLGVYDIHKKVKRLATHSVLLNLLARKIAFRLHVEHKRYESISEMEKWAEAFMEGHVAKGKEIRSLHELIDPCNVLLPMTDDGKCGFGHLQYQEHLVAQEIAQNRGIDIVPLMEQPWWRGAFCIYAQMNQDLDTLIWRLAQDGQFYRVSNTIHAMVRKLSGVRRADLESMIRKIVVIEGDSG